MGHTAGFDNKPRLNGSKHVPCTSFLRMDNYHFFTIQDMRMHGNGLYVYLGNIPSHF